MQKKDGMIRVEEEKLFNFRPVFFVAIFLCLGIGFFFLTHFRGVSTLWFLVLPLLAAFPFFFCASRKKLFSAIAAASVLACAFFLGYFSFVMQLNRYADTQAVEGERYVSGYVTEKRFGTSRAWFVIDGVRIGEERVDGKLTLYLPLEYYEKITLADEIFTLANVSEAELQGDVFSLQAKNVSKDVRYSAYAEEVTVTGSRFDLFLKIRARACKVIDMGMNKDAAAVTKAVLFGDTEEIDAELYENVRRGGVAHIFAVSGLHVGALFSFFLLAIAKTPIKRLPKIARFALTFALLFLYAGICSFSPSVVRASVLCLIAYASRLLGLKTDLLESLGGAASCILFCTPSALFEVGFQLSFAACFGIAFLAKPIGQVFDECAKQFRKIFPRKLTKGEIEALVNDDTLPQRLSAKLFSAIRDFLSVSVAAQIFTAPILLSCFGYVSGWALLLNCIFVPIVSGLFSLLLLFVVAACCLPAVFAFVVLYVPNVLWSALLLLFEGIDFTGFAIEGWTIGVSAILPYYLACTLISDKWNIKKKVRCILVCTCILTFVATMYALNV